jgi:predicted aconitase
VQLTTKQQAMAAGEMGEGVAFALRLLVGYGTAVGAQQLIPISAAHIDGCLYHGQVSLDFVNRFVAAGARVAVPTSLNVGSIDLIHPELFAGDEALRRDGTALMQAHLALGCAPTFSCAPYLTLFRPHFGDQIAWAESNAIVFANSVIGARTARYGDFIDLAGAITGLVPHHGLHVTENRRATLHIALDRTACAELAADELAVAAGLVTGRIAGDRVPVLTGLPDALNEDHLKALGAAAASTGQVAMFHAVGLTPEAATMDAAAQGRIIEKRIDVSLGDLLSALSALTTVADGEALSAVCLGTPHFSLNEFSALRMALMQAGSAPRVPIYVNTGRDTALLLEERRWTTDLEAAGVTIVVDTCTYLTPILRDLSGAVMTNSGKMALYAPGNIGARIAFGSLDACVRSAVAGEVLR